MKVGKLDRHGKVVRPAAVDGQKKPFLHKGREDDYLYDYLTPEKLAEDNRFAYDCLQEAGEYGITAHEIRVKAAEARRVPFEQIGDSTFPACLHYLSHVKPARGGPLAFKKWHEKQKDRRNHRDQPLLVWVSAEAAKTLGIRSDQDGSDD